MFDRSFDRSFVSVKRQTMCARALSPGCCCRDRPHTHTHTQCVCDGARTPAPPTHPNKTLCGLIECRRRPSCARIRLHLRWSRRKLDQMVRDHDRALVIHRSFSHRCGRNGHTHPREVTFRSASWCTVCTGCVPSRARAHTHTHSLTRVVRARAGGSHRVARLPSSSVFT